MTGQESDSDAIEEQARIWIEQGYVPSDSEPGEWLTLQHPETGHEITITPDGTEEAA